MKSSDGRYRLVISLADPGVPNWLDPVGHHEGAIIYRYQLATASNSSPTTRLVSLEELRKYLPADTLHVGPEARQAQVHMRQLHAARRWAP